MNLELKAKVKEIKELQQITDNFKKQTVIVEYKEKEKIKLLTLDFINDNIEKIKFLNLGITYNFKFNLNCNESKGKYYLSANCWYVEQIKDIQNENDGLPF